MPWALLSTACGFSTSVRLGAAATRMVNKPVSRASRSWSDLRFKQGASNAVDVLDAQRSRFATPQAAVQVLQVQNLVTLYKVLGDGWK